MKKSKGSGAHSLQYETRVGFKEKVDPVCLTKKETRFIDNWLKKHEGKFHKKWVSYEETGNRIN